MSELRERLEADLEHLEEIARAAAALRGALRLELTRLRVGVPEDIVKPAIHRWADKVETIRYRAGLL